MGRLTEVTAKDIVEEKLAQLHRIVLELEDARKRLKAIVADRDVQQAKVRRLTADADVALDAVSVAIAAACRSQDAAGQEATWRAAVCAAHRGTVRRRTNGSGTLH
jgi:hypothetical protein